MTLLEVIRINEEIKYVVKIAREISLAATNAKLITKRVGDRAVGFSVVAGELRLFSGRMMERMDALSQQAETLAMSMAVLQKQARAYRYFAQASACADVAKEKLGVVLAVQGQRLVDAEIRLRDEGRELHRLALRAWRECGMGRVLAHNGKIEATQGGEWTSALMDVARRFEDAVERIFHVLAQIKKSEAA